MWSSSYALSPVCLGPWLGIKLARLADHVEHSEAKGTLHPDPVCQGRLLPSLPQKLLMEQSPTLASSTACFQVNRHLAIDLGFSWTRQDGCSAVPVPMEGPGVPGQRYVPVQAHEGAKPLLVAISVWLDQRMCVLLFFCSFSFISQVYIE